MICPECYHDMFGEFWCGECDFGPGIYMCKKALDRATSRITAEEFDRAFKQLEKEIEEYHKKSEP